MKNIKVENDTYVDIKPVREAFGTAYLAILEAINEYLIVKKGFIRKELPKSVEAYRDLFKKYFTAHNGKFMREFDKLYDTLHIAGYYQGLLYDTTLVKESLKLAKSFIDKIRVD